ncbi:ribosomal protein S5 domain 2-type protein [Podospora aff. communis PSN243]|uniref:Ribosomal protein S5 domain 2-type protein n=1 Tax=Podospora aff. communis PSN243 TaxID=3040156 RepID=A0AAV9H416_9PEZI|nr:ribosomal protein S5 domain 2-type protein [Podospora aff. communis PSN243]
MVFMIRLLLNVDCKTPTTRNSTHASHSQQRIQSTPNMSEALIDEIEAINSIYGDGTLVPLSDSKNQTQNTYILTLPPCDDGASSSSSSLRLQFTPSYPDDPPTVLATHSVGGHSKRGAAARDLDLFRAAVGEVFEPGVVCLFDALEKVKELVSEAEARAGGDRHEKAEVDGGEGEGERGEEEEEVACEVGEEQPPWTMSDPVVELKSSFIARCAPVTSPGQAARFVQHLLATDKRVRSATHNMTAWRIRGENGASFQDCDDDGETAAGGRLLHLMQLMDLWDTMIIVTRWYGGQKLGPRRFALINQAARDAFVKAGLVSEGGAGTKKKGHGK